MALELCSTSFPKERLSKLSEQKRLFFVLGGYLTNEVTMLNKLLAYFSLAIPTFAKKLGRTINHFLLAIMPLLAIQRPLNASAQLAAIDCKVSVPE